MTYRPEIDGLRTIAVVSVVLYHADLAVSGQNVLAGGFLGVDIFFVISGFLITGLLAADLERGTFSLGHFYERRARRLLPALLLVMAVSTPFAWAIMTTNALIEYAQSLLAALLFSSNFFFWLQDSYTAEPSQLKPFLHTWSLALEEQYYIVFPVVLLVVWRFARQALIPVLVGMALLSLCIAAYLSTRNTDANFFLMPSRAWELLVGAILALQLEPMRRVVPIAVMRMLPAMGLTAIAVPMWFYHDAMPHPSLWTVLPVLGVAMIILAAHEREPVTRLLSTRPMVGIGLISYSFYLWHFPIFAFGRILNHDTETHMDLGIWIALSAALAYLSWRFVEQPFRDRKQMPVARLIAIVGTASVALAGYAGLIAREVIVDRYAAIPAGLHDDFKAWAPAGDPDTKCVDRETFLDPSTWCRLGITGVGDGVEGSMQPVDFLLIGDSHALAYASFFDAAARNENRFGALISRSGCSLLLDLDPGRGEPLSGQCLQLADKVLNYASAHKIRDVYLAVRWNYYTCGEPVPSCGYTQNTRFRDGARAKEEASRLANLREAFEHSFARYVEEGIRLHVLLQAPHQPRNARDIYSDFFQDQKEATLAALSVKYRHHMRFTQKVRAIVEAAARRHDTVAILDPSDVICLDRKSCPVGTPQASYYQDDDHLSPGANEVMTPWVQRHLAKSVN